MHEKGVDICMHAEMAQYKNIPMTVSANWTSAPSVWLKQLIEGEYHSSEQEVGQCRRRRRMTYLQHQQNLRQMKSMVPRVQMQWQFQISRRK